MKTPIMQFGTSRFLQAHADLFVSEALEKGEALGTITVVQTTDSAGRAERLHGLAAEGGFSVIIRGLENGLEVDHRQQVTSVARALSASANWPEITRIFVKEVEVVICNTADRGYDITQEPEEMPRRIPLSFPGKLTLLLHARFMADKRPLTVLPCELISRNGEILGAIVRNLADRWYADTAFDRWLDHAVIFCNTLVDRIVSQALSPAGAVAEPYALWAIQRVAGQQLPCVHPAIVVAEDVASFERLKLFILNLGHTLLADRWMEAGQPEGLTVREILADPAIQAYLTEIYAGEILPGFAAKDMEDAAIAYIATTLERFHNPFLDHRLSDIAQNHQEKITRRLGGFMAWSGLPAPRLSQIISGPR